MSLATSAEAFCPACNRERLLLRKPKYDGFTRLGEEVTCATCGHVFEATALPAAAPKKPDIFGADDQPQKIELFHSGEAEKLCRRCVSYTVNPFRQWCARHRREVEATDTCAQFAPKPPEPPAPPPAKPKNILLAALLSLALFQ
jgi:hypothetical protein